ncbi:U4/U6 small nuclear ribonucleo protein [Venturia nashicola]|nr:U4/U6 small nuclear ribonucleo protein [Venturia nashicola]
MADSKKRSAPVDHLQKVAEARKRAEEARKRVENANAKAIPTPPPPAPAGNGSNGPNGTTGSPAPPAPSKPMSRLEEIKARVAAAQAKTVTPAASATPPQRAPPTRPPPPPSAPPPVVEERIRTELGNSSRGGLTVGIHPSLLGDSRLGDGKKDGKSKDKREKKVESDNPYFAEEKWSGRRSRALNFTHNMRDRPAMTAANDLRRKAHMEEIKKRIEQTSIAADLGDGSESQAFVVPMPPDVEFWDESFQAGIDDNEIITRLVVHPIFIDPPQDKFTSGKPQAMHLTTKEQKKMRRIRRAEEHKEEQAKIRLGLVPTPAPKIKHTNVMRVYGEMAVQDPTAVEAMVNKQIQDRKTTHEEANAARQLSKEEKAEKIKKKSEENAALGLFLSVYKIDLTKEQLLGKHRFKIDKNAKDWHDITGVVIVAPKFSIVIVEAGVKATKEYEKLLTRRMKWQLILQGNGEILQSAAESTEEDYTCTLLHKGQIKARKFKKWGSFREVDTETQGRDVLSRAKLETFWTQAKAMPSQSS